MLWLSSQSPCLLRSSSPPPVLYDLDADGIDESDVQTEHSRQSSPYIYGIGLSLHEHPMLNPAADELLAPGMVLCIEPAHHDEDVADYHIEDLVVVTAGTHLPLWRKLCR